MSCVALAGCAGVAPGPHTQARDEAAPVETEEPRLRAERPDRPPGNASRKSRSAETCDSGRLMRSAFYWQGRRTASGEPFNPDGLTAAHRTLPFGTKLTVTNPRTGKSVDVRINDRGPFTYGLQLDLSRGAARAIGFTGTGPVCVS